jgi:hypothetical protein
VIAFRFGAPRRELFATLHVAEGGSARDTAILVCAPFGQEMHQSHRLLRVFADRSARSGYPTMRFDPFGTGDSDGDDGDLTLPGWREDLLSSCRELQRRSGRTQLAILGVGLGANVAIEATHEGMRPRRLVLLDPEADGLAYLARLRARHLRYLDSDLGRMWRPRAWSGDVSTRAPIDEALGYALSQSLRAEIESIDLRSGPAVPSLVLSTRVDPGLESRVSGWSDGEMQRLALRIAWDSDEAMNSAVLPAELLDRMIASFANLP